MNIRRNIFSLSIFALSLWLISPSLAQPSGFGGVTPEKIAELESMHQQAIDFLVKNDFQGAVRTYSDILLMEPDDETAYTGLGQIYMVQGRYRLANEAFKNALDINKSNEVALAGIRRIMDPDGMEGMTSQTELETEGYVAEMKEAGEARRASFSTSPVSASMAPPADMEKRLSAVKAKKGYRAPPPAAVQPKMEAVIKPAKTRSAGRAGRLGLLHAQRTQMALRKAGFYKGPVNGMIGSATKAAIKDFQGHYGIPPSGRMTGTTWAKLSEHLSL